MNLKLLTITKRKLERYKILRDAGWSAYKILFLTLVGRINIDTKLKEFRRLSFKIAKERYGLKFTRDSIIQEVILDRIYTQFQDFVPSKKDIVIDVGSQSGDYAILCAKYYKAKTYAFEPLKENIRIFRTNMKLNDISASELKVYPIALGDKNKRIKISFTGNMMHINEGKAEQQTTIKTLDSLNLAPTILKIDVEGFEMAVLKGAKNTIQKYHPKIIVETHSSDLKKQVLDFLGRLGYGVVHNGRIVNGTDWMDSIQNLFLKAD